MKPLDFDDEYPEGEYEGETVREVMKHDIEYLAQLDPDNPERDLWSYSPAVLEVAEERLEEFWNNEAYHHAMGND